MLCTVLIMNIGKVYPIVKSFDVIGEAYILTRNEPLLSFETVSEVNSITKVCPNTATPAQRLSI